MKKIVKLLLIIGLSLTLLGGCLFLVGFGMTGFDIFALQNVQFEEKEYIDVAKKVNKVHQPYRRIYHNFIHPKEDERGALMSLTFENEDKFKEIAAPYIAE